MQQIQGRLPEKKRGSPVIGPDATGPDWIYEYVLVDHSHQRSLADLRVFQDWYLLYQLATVPGCGGSNDWRFVRQYQVNVDPDSFALTESHSLP